MAESERVRKDGANERLSAYTAKDYTEVIEFPVELVDRDGVVRRYSYEESLAVYHRRIQSAPWRYGEDELVRAEIGHCSRRIDQIKRSYLLRAERTAPAATSDPRAALGEGYEVLRRHYSRVLRGRGRPTLGSDLPLRVTLLHDEPACRAYHVSGPEGEGGHVLYVHPFDRRGDGDPQDAFRAAAALYRGLPRAPDIERLLHEEAGADAGYLLCGTEELPGSLLALGRDPDGAGPSGPDEPPPISAGERPGAMDLVVGLNAMRAGDPEGALEHLRHAVQQNPWNRDAYIALLSLLDGMDRSDEAEFWAALAASHIPEDGFLRFRHGVQLARQGRFDEAIAAFDDAAERSPTLHHPLLFAAQILLARGRDLPGATSRLERAASVSPEDDEVADLWATARRAGRIRRGAVAVGFLLTGIGGVAAVGGLTEGRLAVGVGLALVLSAWPITAAWLMFRLRRTLRAESEP